MNLMNDEAALAEAMRRDARAMKKPYAGHSNGHDMMTSREAQQIAAEENRKFVLGALSTDWTPTSELTARTGMSGSALAATLTTLRKAGLAERRGTRKVGEWRAKG